jgi:hypothetical protein
MKMETIKVSVPATIELVLKHNGKQTVDLSNMPPEWFAEAIANGIRQSAGDADAGLGGEDMSVRAAAVLAKFQRILSGVWPSSGGGGARLSYVDKAWRIILKARMVRAGWKATEADKLVKDREKAMVELFAKLLTVKYGTTPETDLVTDAITRNLPAFEKDVDREAAELEAADKRRAEIAAGASGLDVDALGIDI